MADKISKRLVIDASVARSAGGEDAKSDNSKYCRDFLQAVLDICHQIVMTPDIKKEWDKHRSNFARTWLRTMVAKKKLYPCQIVMDKELWSQVESFAETDKQQEDLINDLRLIEAALATDKIVISLDEKVRKLFAKASEQVDELQKIVWVNPAKIEEQPVIWLESGAESELERQLGFKLEETN